MTQEEQQTTNKPDKFERTLEGMMTWLIYALVFCILFGVAGTELTTRQCIGYSLMLGLITGSINNVGHILSQIKDKEK